MFNRGVYLWSGYEVNTISCVFSCLYLYSLVTEVSVTRPSVLLLLHSLLAVLFPLHFLLTQMTSSRRPEAFWSIPLEEPFIVFLVLTPAVGTGADCYSENVNRHNQLTSVLTLFHSLLQVSPSVHVRGFWEFFPVAATFCLFEGFSYAPSALLEDYVPLASESKWGHPPAGCRLH